MSEVWGWHSSPKAGAKGVASLADHLKELEVVLLAGASLDEEPVDDGSDTAPTTGEELGDAEPRITN